MNPEAASSPSTVSNLMPAWDGAADGGGSFEPGEAAGVVARVVAAPERCAPTEPMPARSAYSAGIVGDQGESWAEQRGLLLTDVLTSDEPDVAPVPEPDYDALRRRDIARELLRARLVALAEQREHRSAYEIVFIMLAAAVAILPAAPPLVQVLLAAHGVQA